MLGSKDKIFARFGQGQDPSCILWRISSELVLPLLCSLEPYSSDHQLFEGNALTVHDVDGYSLLRQTFYHSPFL